MFPYQKKAEEAHRILEGLGPRVELVRRDFDFNVLLLFLYFSLSRSHFCIIDTWEHFTEGQDRGINDAWKS